MTKIQFDKDADEMLEVLMNIWDEPGGQRIRDAWTKNVFPSLAKAQSTPTASVDPVPEPAPKRRGNTAAQMIERNRAAVAAPAAPAQQGTPEHEGESYHSSFS